LLFIKCKIRTNARVKWNELTVMQSRLKVGEAKRNVLIMAQVKFYFRWKL